MGSNLAGLAVIQLCLGISLLESSSGIGLRDDFVESVDHGLLNRGPVLSPSGEKDLLLVFGLLNSPNFGISGTIRIDG